MNKQILDDLLIKAYENMAKFAFEYTATRNDPKETNFTQYRDAYLAGFREALSIIEDFKEKIGE